MAAAVLQNTWKAYVDEDRFWSYHDMLIEVVAVLWISTSVSAELAKQYFPDWQSSRKDQNNADGGKDPCLWDRAVSYWKICNGSACQYKSEVLPTPSSTGIAVGYAGMYATMIATIILYLLFFYSLFVNRLWRMPTQNSTVVALHEMRKLLDFIWTPPEHLLDLSVAIVKGNAAAVSGTMPNTQTRVNERDKILDLDKILDTTEGRLTDQALLRAQQKATVSFHSKESQPDEVHTSLKCDLHLSTQQSTPEPCSVKCVFDDGYRSFDSESCCCVAGSMFRITAALFIIITPVFTVIAVLWLVVLILPVPLLATLITRTANGVIGEEAVLPSYILLTLSLTVYSAGRMAGLWMRSTYLFWIWKTTRNFRWNNQGKPVTATSFRTVNDQTSPFAGSKSLGYGVPTLVFTFYVFNLCSKLFAANVPCTATNETDCSNFSDVKVTAYWTTSASYLINGSALRNPAIDDFPVESSLTRAFVEFRDVWFLMLTYVLMCPFLVASAVYVGLAFRWCAVNHKERQRRSNPVNKPYAKWYTYLYDYRPQLANCWCTETLQITRYLSLLALPTLALLLLPFPFLEWALPEDYHIPGLVLIATGGTVATVSAWAQWLWANWCAYRRYPHDPLGGKLRCGGHPLCYRFQNPNAALITATEAMQTPTAIAPVMGITVDICS